MVLNPGECYYMTFGLNTTNSKFVLEDGTIVPSAEMLFLLGITVDSRLTFYCHLKQLRKRVANKLNALTRIASYLSYNQRRFIYSSLFTGQLSYCPLIWAFSFRQSDNLINNFQERPLRVPYNDYDSRFSELLEMPNESTIQIKNIKVHMTEMYKFLNDLSPPIMNDSFQKQENYYSLRNRRSLVSKQKFTTTYDINTISFSGPQI